MTHQNTRRGFTLIELLVGVLIIGILAAVALPQYQMAVEKARYTEAEVWVDAIAKAEHLWLLEHGEYTRDLSELNIGDFSLSSVGNWAIGNVFCFVSLNWRLFCKSHNGNLGWYLGVDLGTNRRICLCYTEKTCKVCRAVTGKTSSCVPSVDPSSSCSYAY